MEKIWLSGGQRSELRKYGSLVRKGQSWKNMALWLEKVRVEKIWLSGKKRSELRKYGSLVRKGKS